MLALQADIARSHRMDCLLVTSGLPGLPKLPSLEMLLERARSNELGEAARLELAAGIAKEQLRIAELDIIPGVTPRIIYQHKNDGADYVGVGVSIPLPFWDRNEPQRLRAQAAHLLAERRSAALQTGIEPLVERLVSAARASEEQARLYADKVIPAFADALQAQERLYAQGQGSVLQVWQTSRALHEVQTQGLQYSLESTTIRGQLSVLVGEDL